MIFIGISSNVHAQVPNNDESQLPSEGSIWEGLWGNYLLGNNSLTRAIRLGVSNDGYTKGEIEIENNNSIGGSIIFKTTDQASGALQRMIIKDRGNLEIHQ